MLAVAKTFALVGAEALRVDVEADIHRGLPAFSIVGLPDAAIRESRERVRAAIVNSGFDFPLKRVTVSLAPSELRKAGPGYDLAIAAAVLVASEQLSASVLDHWSLAGELALDGTLRPVRGALAMAEAAAELSETGIVVPRLDAAEAQLVPGVRVAPLRALGDLRALAEGEIPEPGGLPTPEPAAVPPDISDLRGQPALRRALEIAAAGAHSLFICGPPGAGKSLAARRLPSILPPLEPGEEIEVRRISGIAGLGLPPGRPFRAPHHSISAAGLIGGGAPLRPGEVTLAHRGVLFLDELGEFQRPALEALRQPLEDGEVTISRAAGFARFPADFQLVAAANPCPCGHGEGNPACRCSPVQLRRYQARLSGALADRIDIQITIRQPGAEALAGDPGETSAAVRRRTVAARERALGWRRGAGRAPGAAGTEGARGDLGELLEADGSALEALALGQRRLGLSGRGWTRVLSLARTCADLDGSRALREPHVAEALSLRNTMAAT